MSDISTLIKEAKPLYFARKKRNNRLKAGGACLFCCLLGFILMPKQQSVPSGYYWDLGDDDTEMVSCVESLGLPVDEYGLLLIG